MIYFNPPINASLAPNLRQDDVLRAWEILINPRTWKIGEYTGLVERWFKDALDTPYVASYNAGRAAFYEILCSFGIGAGDEVMIQGFTCVAVPNSICWAGAKPIFVDIDKSFNINCSDAEKKITARTKAIVVQHTFGIPADMDAVRKFATKHNLFVIEDCAHSLGGTLNNKRLGSFGDAAFFSFGRDKVLSTVFGGVAAIHKKHAKAGNTLFARYDRITYPENFWILQQLLHLVVFPLILKTYALGPGKIILFVMQKLHLLSIPIDSAEKNGKNPGNYPQKYPNALAAIALTQINKLPAFTRIRSKITNYYVTSLSGHSRYESFMKKSDTVLLRLPYQTENVRKLQMRCRAENILLGNWYRTVIDAGDATVSNRDYVDGSCPVAEKFAGNIVNLPTNISIKDAGKIVDVINRYHNHLL